MIIYNKSGIELCKAHKFTYSGTFMGETYITTTITSEQPIMFGIGAYCEYRGERFELNYVPSVEKVASTDSYGDAYKYEDVKFSFLANELSHCSFLDYVPYDNNTQYSGQPSFSFVGTIYNLAERINANLDRIYYTLLSGTISTTESSTTVTGVGTLFTTEIAVGDRVLFGGQIRVVSAIASNTSLTVSSMFTLSQSGVSAKRYHWNIRISDGYSTKDFSVSVSNITCMDALALANTTFGSNFIVRGRDVTIGTAGINVSSVFGYGKGNGLRSIKQSANNDSAIITRLRAFGSNKNIPYRWYNNQINPSTSQPYLSESMYVPNLTLPSFLVNGGDAYVDAGVSFQSYDGGNSSTTTFAYSFDGGTVINTPITSTIDGGNAYSSISYIDLYGVREGIVYFDGSDDREDIHPTLENITASQIIAAGIPVTLYSGDNGNLDEIYSAINQTDNGILPNDGSSLEGTFTIVIKDLGFDLSEKLSDGSYKYASSDGDMTISMKSGNCAARDFTIVENGITKVVDGGVITYKLVCNRQKDDDIGMSYPNSNYQVNSGDKFVLVNIQMPDVYVYAAMQRLYTAALEYLNANNTSKFIYEPEIDNLFMARNPAIGYSLKEGDIFNFEDLDVPVSNSVIIKTLEIQEEESTVPKYTITLSNETTSTTIQQIKNEVKKNSDVISNLDNIQKGAQGDVGAVLSYRGEYDAGKNYHGGKTYRDAVLYNGVYYVARTDANTFSNRLPTDVSKWVIFGNQLESVATGLLLAQSAWINNLIVSKLGTSSNPYSERFSNIGSGVGVFRNLGDESSIDNAIIGMGKDVSIMQQSGERKPAFVVRDKQWRGTYSSSTIYYKDDRVYYNGATYIFTKDWLETDTPSAGYLPTNVSYWQYIGSGNLGGGQYSEIGSEGVFSNGSNIMGFSVATGVTSNFSAAYLLQRRNAQSNGISAAVLGMDQTDETDGVSKSYGGYFNSAYIGRIVHSIRNVSASGDILKSDYKIHSYASSAITLTLPIADNSMIGQDIFVRKLGAGNVTVVRGGSQSLWLGSSITSTVVDHNALTLFCWDGNYWVVNEFEIP